MNQTQLAAAGAGVEADKISPVAAVSPKTARLRELRRSTWLVAVLTFPMTALVAATNWHAFSGAAKALLTVALLLAASVPLWAGRAVAPLVAASPDTDGKLRKVTWALFGLVLLSEAPAVVGTALASVLARAL